MSKRYSIFVVAATCFVLAAAGFAQAPGGDAYKEFREKHKYTFELVSMARNIDRIDKDSKYTLTQDQAKKVLAVLQPLRSKPKLTQDQAKQALEDLKKIFTSNQLNAMAKINPRPLWGERPQDGRRPGAFPRKGQPGGPPGGDRRFRPKFDPDAMKDFNPFYAKAPKGDKLAAARVKRWDEFFTSLHKKANPPKKAAAKSTSNPSTKPAPKKK